MPLHLIAIFPYQVRTTAMPAIRLALHYNPKLVSGFPQVSQLTQRAQAFRLNFPIGHNASDM